MQDGPVLYEQWWKPGRLAIKRGLLVHDYRAWWEHPTYTGPTPGMLEGFLALADGTDEEIAEYAGDRGFLDLCRHGLPVEIGDEGPALFRSHPRSVRLPPYLALARARDFPVEGFCYVLGERYEPTSMWRYWASQARGLVGVGVALAGRRPVFRRDLIRLFERSPWAMPAARLSPKWEEEERRDRLTAFVGPDDHHPILPSRELRRTVEDALDFWLDMGRMRLRLRLAGRGPEAFFTGGLFSYLGTQLLMAIEGRLGFVICPGDCGGMPHLPVRPNDTRASYCPACRQDKVSQKRAAANYEVKRRRRRLATTERTARAAAEVVELPTGEALERAWPPALRKVAGGAS